ncbi:short chain dehydrogenase/reductase family oxidoreductase [Penicillium malachiteum]|uniref:short chain dehydrogenase/reductase family oxidoreductase n=1 Tax=Penicillium malachiteum TaxID=1324776 RepID=UPI0025480A67|nr:short chain dehydrogenase/reductase family oxidoreductase [Penicillium malachiteum]KAJ5729954.1 short chain dehydrogenase/reductase family oxidoreductase [Penicillium malachiteum]
MTVSTVRSLEGKFAIVTGGSRGIGAAIARDLASKGCSVLATYTSDSSTKPTEELCAELVAQHGIKAHGVKADLQLEEAGPAIIKAAQERFSENGKLVIDILVNNAGVGSDYPLGKVPVSEFHRIYAVNVLAPILVTQAALPYLPHDRSGRIINISSVASSIGFATHTLFGGTKAALEAMTRTWARELAERATVNAVNPGPVEGGMYFATGEKFWKQMEPFQLNCLLSAVREGVDDPSLVKLAVEEMGGRRPAYWKEIATVVGMLCGSDSAWTTGSFISCNGGFKFQT